MTAGTTCHRWTDEERAELERAWTAGEDVHAIAERLGMTEAAVRSYAALRGIRRPEWYRTMLAVRNNGGHPWSDAGRELLTLLWTSNVRSSDIAERMGHTVSAIRRQASSMHLRRTRPVGANRAPLPERGARIRTAGTRAFARLLAFVARYDGDVGAGVAKALEMAREGVGV